VLGWGRSIVAAGVIDLDAVPVSLHPLFGESSYQERCRFAKGLKNNLSQAEVDALIPITLLPETPDGVEQVKTFTAYALLKEELLAG
jgi:hypothetical protein